MNFPPILQNRLALHTFLTLFISFIILQTAGFFIYDAISRLNGDFLPSKVLAREVVKVVDITQAVPPDRLHKVMRLIRHPGVHVLYTNKHVDNIPVFRDLDPHTIQERVMANPKTFAMRIPFKDDKWIIISTHMSKPIWRVVAAYSTGLLILGVLFLLCAWVANVLALPIDEFTKTAKRFSKDLNTPPIPETGPKSIREACKALNEMKARLSRILDDRTQMLAAISHDLRTPITRLKLRAENIACEKQSNKILQDLSEMEYMINSILSFARNQVKNEPVKHVDLNALLDSISDDMQDAGYQVTFENHGQRILFYGRINALKRAINNLIENAVKYGKEANISVKNNASQILIKVTDKGPGIPEDETENVFSPFYRIDTARSPKTIGSGLGLAVARDIIRAHDGEITLRNYQPLGLCAIITLPIT